MNANRKRKLEIDVINAKWKAEIEVILWSWKAERDVALTKWQAELDMLGILSTRRLKNAILVTPKKEAK